MPVYFEHILRRSAETLIAVVVGRPREWVIAHPEAELSAGQVEQFHQMAAQYARGVPLPYIIGEQPFFNYTFTVTPDVMVPRWETEQVVELALQQLKAKTPQPQILDIGTGSGIIGVTLALELPGAHVTATDISPAALAVARGNAGRLGVLDRMEFVVSDLLAGLAEPGRSFDLICANLPYIPAPDLGSLEVARHEPLVALDGGEDGLHLMRRFMADAPRVLAPGGGILLEIDYRQGAAVSAIGLQHFPGAQVVVHKDLARLERVVEITI
jgi:release factor glutamine methyltransferase